jgi:hypothetical protein
VGLWVKTIQGLWGFDKKWLSLQMEGSWGFKTDKNYRFEDPHQKRPENLC